MRLFIIVKCLISLKYCWINARLLQKLEYQETMTMTIRASHKSHSYRVVTINMFDNPWQYVYIHFYLYSFSRKKCVEVNRKMTVIIWIWYNIYKEKWLFDTHTYELSISDCDLMRYISLLSQDNWSAAV